jgi:hypothetical protein
MKRRTWCWLALLFGVPGCGDTIQAVRRDYYNIEHEVIDNMIQIVDEESAKRYNTAFKNRLKVKEEANKARFDKIQNNQFSEADRKILADTLIDLDANVLKLQNTSLEFRFRQAQHHIRKLIVKLAEDKAEEMKRQGRTFTVEAKEICPNLSISLEVPERFVKNEGGGGGMMPMMMNMMPAGAGPQGMPGGGGPAAGGGQAAGSAQANRNLNFVMTCDLIQPGQWAQPRKRWMAGAAEIPSPFNVEGFDLAPLSSN